MGLHRFPPSILIRLPKPPKVIDNITVPQTTYIWQASVPWREVMRIDVSVSFTAEAMSQSYLCKSGSASSSSSSSSYANSCARYRMNTWRYSSP